MRTRGRQTKRRGPTPFDRLVADFDRPVSLHGAGIRETLRLKIGDRLCAVADKYRGSKHERAVRETWEAAAYRILQIQGDLQ